MELEGWEHLEEPIDRDIDEGDYVGHEGASLINPLKKQMIRMTYQKVGKHKMQRQKDMSSDKVNEKFI